jgi:hypothetical protein
MAKLIEDRTYARAQSNVQHGEYDEISYGEVRDGLHGHVLDVTLTASSDG